jgi:hypothetical protein
MAISVGSRVVLSGAPAGSKHGTVTAMNVSEPKPSINTGGSSVSPVTDSTGVTVVWDNEGPSNASKTYPLADLVAVTN